MPISEYDTLGSDSEGVGPADSPPTFAESAAMSRAFVHHVGGRTRPDPGLPHNRGSSDIFKHRSRTRQQSGMMLTLIHSNTIKWSLLFRRK